MRSPDALLFDFGNVLVHIDFGRVFAHWANAAGVPIKHIAARFDFDEPFRAHEDRRLEAAAYFAKLRGILEIDLPDDQFLEGWNAVYVDEVGGIGELLEELARRHSLFLYSNTNRAHYDVWKVRYAHLLRHFQALFVSHELGFRKPSPEGFKVVAGKMGHAPERIAFFDDLAENVAGAKAAGMQAFQVASVAEIRQALEPS